MYRWKSCWITIWVVLCCVWISNNDLLTHRFLALVAIILVMAKNYKVKQKKSAWILEHVLATKFWNDWRAWSSFRQFAHFCGTPLSKGSESALLSTPLQFLKMEDLRGVKSKVILKFYSTLQLKYKRRVYKMLHLDEKQLKAVNSKASRKKFADHVANNNVDKVNKMCAKGLDPNYHCQDSHSGGRDNTNHLS